jgi:adenine phosphoribosyltransferase
MIEQKIKQAIRDVADFPQEGVIFKDVTPLLADPVLSNEICEAILGKFAGKQIDAIVAVESRGFLYGFLLAHKLRVPFIPVRKKGKLPGETVEFSYDLEYGSATVEVHSNDLKPGWNVLIHDDLLATGGTAAAAAELMRMQKVQVAGYAFIIELSFLNGVKKIRPYCDTIVSLATY